MGSTAWAAVLMVVVAVVIAAAFILLWMRDKDRADEEAVDPERVQTGPQHGPDPAEGTPAESPEIRSERRP
ncbi:MAG TPA: hypothetical protein VFE07_14990 [Marmoricola sp.]|nr:hypothetical protein [Marmoricola sp.]